MENRKKKETDERNGENVNTEVLVAGGKEEGGRTKGRQGAKPKESTAGELGIMDTQDIAWCVVKGV